MKLNTLTKTALLVIAGALTIQSAKAQFNPSVAGDDGAAVSGDLVLNFTDDGTTDYELDLGQFSTYTMALHTIDIANIASDLGTLYGSGSFTTAFDSSSLVVGIVGINNSGSTVDGVKNSSVFASDTSLVPYAGETSSTLGGPVSDIAAEYNPAKDTTNPPTDGTPTGGDGAYEVPAANLYGYDKTLSKISSNYPRLDENLDGTAPKLYLDTLQPGASSFVAGTSTEDLNGYFTITSAGEVEFDVPSLSTPEPSTYALMILGGALLACWQLRRKATSSEI
jgi:hypothetical protein